MRKRSDHKQLLFVLGVLLIAGGVAAYLVNTKSDPPRAQPAAEGTLVEVAVVKKTTEDVRVTAKGTVVAAKEVMLQPQLTGRVTWQNDELIAGGRLSEDDPVIKIDNRDYKLAVESNRAELNRAKLELALEKRRSAVAKKEWDTFGDTGAGEQQKALALREPQLASAKVAVSAAESGLKKARLDLARTTLKAPFNAMVLSESVDLGQLVSAQSTVARLVGTDAFHVQVSVPVNALATIRPRHGETPGSSVAVTQTIGDQQITREGELIRQLPDLDPGGAMARVLVRIDDPVGDGGELPLLLGSFVNVSLEAGTLSDVAKIPRSALHDGSQVYVMNADNMLEVREVEVVWRMPDTVLVRSGLESGDRMVTSRIGTPLPNMLLRTADETPASPTQASPSDESTRTTPTNIKPASAPSPEKASPPGDAPSTKPAGTIPSNNAASAPTRAAPQTNEPSAEVQR